MPYMLVDLLRRKQIPEEKNGFLYCCCLCFSLQTFLITHLPQPPDWMAMCFMTPVWSHMRKEWAVSWGQILGFYCWRVKIVICIIASEIWSRYGALTSQAWLTNTTDKSDFVEGTWVSRSSTDNKKLVIIWSIYWTILHLHTTTNQQFRQDYGSKYFYQP